jgi:hypothetical protein
MNKDAENVNNINNEFVSIGVYRTLNPTAVGYKFFSTSFRPYSGP